MVSLNRSSTAIYIHSTYTCSVNKGCCTKPTSESVSHENRHANMSAYMCLTTCLIQGGRKRLTSAQETGYDSLSNVLTTKEKDERAREVETERGFLSGEDADDEDEDVRREPRQVPWKKRATMEKSPVTRESGKRESGYETWLRVTTEKMRVDRRKMVKKKVKLEKQSEKLEEMTTRLESTRFVPENPQAAISVPFEHEVEAFPEMASAMGLKPELSNEVFIVQLEKGINEMHAFLDEPYPSEEKESHVASLASELKMRTKTVSSSLLFDR